MALNHTALNGQTGRTFHERTEEHIKGNHQSKSS